MFFGGAPLWHVSVVLWSRLTSQPKPVASWSRDDRSRAETIASRVLESAGVAHNALADLGGLALHVRRETTAQERDAVFKTPRGRLAALKHNRG